MNRETKDLLITVLLGFAALCVLSFAPLPF